MLQVVRKLSKVYPKDVEAPAGGVDDMTKLSYLHEPGVLQNLKTRYELNEIYVRYCSYCLDCVWFLCSFLCYNTDNSAHLLIFDIITDLYRKYLNCNKSISKIASFVWYAYDATIQGGTIWRIKPSCLCHCRCCLQVPPSLSKLITIICVLLAWYIELPLLETGQWSMRGKAILFWLAVKVEPVKLRQPRCLCDILPFWVAVQQLKGALWSNKSLVYDNMSLITYYVLFNFSITHSIFT